MNPYAPFDKNHIVDISHLNAFQQVFISEINALKNKLNVIERDNEILQNRIKEIKTKLNSISIIEFIKKKIKKENIC